MVLLVLRGSFGCNLLDSSSSSNYKWRDQCGYALDLDKESKNIRAITFCNSGKLLAWSNATQVKVVKCIDDKMIPLWTLDTERVSALQFSPQDNLLAVWRIYASGGLVSGPNLHLYCMKTGSLLKSFFQKRNEGWCPQWSADESICCRSVSNEIHFYFGGNFDVIISRLSLSSENLSLFSKAPNGPNLVCLIAGKKGLPSFAKFYAYPNLEDNKVIGSRSFFQADSMNVEWNSNGTVALLLVQADVDKTGASYYGKSQLYLMNSCGESELVHLPKTGPVYCVQWRPPVSGCGQQQFVVVYGFMPAKVTLYNSKCQKVFDYGTGSRNIASFNQQGNLLLIGGFGNLRGQIEIWDMNLNKRVSSFEAADTTAFQWCPDGQRLMTCTCFPRLRQSNGLRIWHYTSSLLFEHDMQKEVELWEVMWQKSLEGKLKDFPISYVPVKSIKPIQSTLAPKQAYRPPGMRGSQPSFLKTPEYEPAENSLKAVETEKCVNSSTSLSASSKRNKRRREAKKNRSELKTNGNGITPMLDEAKIQPSKVVVDSASANSQDKRLSKLKEKLASVESLKTRLKSGQKLDTNQMEKISKEKQILAEIQQLSI